MMGFRAVQRWRHAMEPEWDFTIVHRTLYFRPSGSPGDAPWVLDMPAASAHGPEPGSLPLDEMRKNKTLYEKTVQDILEKYALFGSVSTPWLSRLVVLV
jgi:hypothetical protein